MNRRIALHILFLILCPLFAKANDTVYVSGGVQHEGLLDWKPVRGMTAVKEATATVIWI